LAEADERPRLVEVGDLRRDEVPWELDRRLAALCRERAPLRAVIARIAARLVDERAWERIGYARLSDYAVERLGLSARSVRSLARVGWRLSFSPCLEDALVSGTLGWTKVRLLASLPHDEDEDEAAWVARARRVTAEELSKQVRAVDRGSIEAGAIEDEARSRRFEVRCSPEVRWKWDVARGAAKRAAGRMLHPAEAAELIAAEVLSALPIDPDAEGPCEEAGVSWSQASEPAGDVRGDGASPRLETAGRELSEEGPMSADCTATAHSAMRLPPRSSRAAGDGAEHAGSTPSPPRPSLPPTLKPLLEGLRDADAFELDRRLRCALSTEQRLDARIGRLLALVWPRPVHRALGHRTREAYARERLGMDPTRARSLVRLERAAAESERFARSYRTGALSWVKASVLVPLVSADPLGWFVGDWVAWAERVTVRRLREDVELALALSETDPEAFRRSGALPPEARHDREIRATERVSREDLTGAGEDLAGGDREIGATERDAKEQTTSADRANAGGSGGEAAEKREIGATDPYPHHHPEPLKSAPHETCWARFFGPADVVRLFRAVLCTVRRRMEREEGRLPTEGEALGAMLDHALSTWGALDAKTAKRHKVFARDGWRCAVPGCTSMQNLHDHHIRFRSAQGSDDLENRVTLCAFHHLRGVHRGLLRCVGRAPDGLRWEMGIRPGVTPLLAYRSGDLRVRAKAPSPAF
jgi:hypothetical protein